MITVLPAVTVTGNKYPDETPLETAYAESVFKRLDQASRYPTSREASLSRPSGIATVWVDVLRTGKVVGHGLEQTSGSPLLDKMAVDLVTRGKHAPLPSDSWAEEAKHRLVVSYQFDGDVQAAGKSARP